MAPNKLHVEALAQCIHQIIISVFQEIVLPQEIILSEVSLRASVASAARASSC